MKRHASGDLILAGALEAALENYDIHIPAPQRADPLVFRVDAKSGKLIWATTFATTTSNPSVANAVAVDGDDVFVAAPRPARRSRSAQRRHVSARARSEHACAIVRREALGHRPQRGLGITFDASRTPYDSNVDGECLTIVASAGEIDVGCNYVGAGFGYGGQVMKTAPLRAVAMIHLVDGPSPTLTRAKSYASDAPMTIYDAARSPSGDVYFLSTAGHAVTDLDGTPVLADAENNGIVGKLSPHGTIAAIAPPVNLVVASRLHDEEEASIATFLSTNRATSSNSTHFPCGARVFASMLTIWRHAR